MTKSTSNRLQGPAAEDIHVRTSFCETLKRRLNARNPTRRSDVDKTATAETEHFHYSRRADFNGSAEHAEPPAGTHFHSLAIEKVAA
jgi:hypothetical protein